MNITMQLYNKIIKWGGRRRGVGGRYGMFKGGYVLSWCEQSSMCRSAWVSLPKGPYLLHLTRNDLSDFTNAQADLSLH